jgi:stage V sporulation protein K
MSNEKKQSAAGAGLVYTILILVSVADICAAGFCAYQVLGMYLSGLPGSLSVTESPYLWMGGTFVGIALWPVLTRARQKYRDLYEYDEKGNSRKRGSKSQLSAAERKQLDIQQMTDQERIFSASERKRITHEPPKNTEAALKELIGLRDVKRDVHEMEARMAYEKQCWKEKHHHGKFHPENAQHMVFYGPPGTGKTTVARIMAGILYRHGYIRKNQCVEVDGNFFLGLSEGETAKRTEMLINHSMGGVLFIDEAYSLVYAPAGREVLATIVKEMEDNRGDIVIILAGYDNEMRKLADLNPGLESRIKKFMDFKAYTTEELKAILVGMANQKGFVVDTGLLDKFELYMDREKKLPNFGNARAVRSFLDRAIDRHAANIMDEELPKEAKYRLTAKDMPDIQKFR